MQTADAGIQTEVDLLDRSVQLSSAHRSLLKSAQQYERSGSVQALQKANKILQSRGLRPLAEMQREVSVDVLLEQLKKTQSILRHKQMVEKQTLYSRYSHDRVLQTLEQSRGQLEQQQNLMIVSTGMEQRGFNVVDMQLVRSTRRPPTDFPKNQRSVSVSQSRRK